MKLCPNCNSEFDSKEWLCPVCNCKTFKPLSGKIGFESKYFDELFKVESESFWFRSRNRLIIWALKKYFPDAKNFLEVGCGTGFVLSGVEKNFPGLDLSGSEVFAEGIKFARKRTKAKLFQMDVRAISFKNEFDVIGAFDVIEHIEQDEEVIKNIYNAVMPGGGIILTVPQHKFLWSKHDVYANHVRRYSAKELIYKVKTAGFNIIKTTSFMTLLLPFLLAFRRSFKGKDIKQDIMSQYKINRFVNRMLEKVLDFERMFIEHGVKFPLGSSLMLIGKKNLQ